MAAEYILKEGNETVMLCERGIRTFETAYRFTLDLMAVPVLKELTHLPVIVDPSHAAGRRDLVESMSLAAAAAGADGIIVEVHTDPEEAICDGPQALRAAEFADYAQQGRAGRRDRRQAAVPAGAGRRRREPLNARGPRRRADRRVDRHGRPPAARRRRPRDRAARRRCGVELGALDEACADARRGARRRRRRGRLRARRRAAAS